ncbi:hypothetical protein [Bremerella sp.]|uniref:hypothetical protein n=1 Tax=Bremerella sp. TaxID=2795602 RepID=UPI00391CE1C5
MQIKLPEGRRSSRLSVAHLFLWIAVASVLAAASSAALTGEVLRNVVFNSAAITAALVAIYYAALNSEWVDAHPGHWCAMVVLWAAIDQWLVAPQLTSWVPGAMVPALSLFFIGAAILFGLGMLIGDWGRAWKVAFAAHAASFALAATWRILQSAGMPNTAEFVRDFAVPPLDGVAVALIVFAVLMDFWWKQLRDWMHWVGLLWVGYQWYAVVRMYVGSYF